MQCLAREHSRKIFEENATLKSQLDAKQRELDLRSNQLDKLVAQNDVERMKLNDERQKVEILLILFARHTIEWNIMGVNSKAARK